MSGRSTAALGLAIVVGLMVWLADRPPTADCGTAASPPSNVYEIAAAKVVVRPWYGRHHVYGIFVVPNQFNDRRYSTALAVRGFEAPIVRKRIPEKGYVDAGLARPGHYLKRVYVPTRVAAWFLLTGHFGDLRTPCHWQLVFADTTTGF